MGEPAGDDGVSGELAHVAAGELPDLGRDAVLLHQRLLGEVELKGVVGGDGDVEASGKVVRQGGAVVGQEEGVVAERAHGDAHLDGGTFINASELNQRHCHLICTMHTHLCEVVEVLDHWGLWGSTVR